MYNPLIFTDIQKSLIFTDISVILTDITNLVYAHLNIFDKHRIMMKDLQRIYHLDRNFYIDS